MNADAVALCRPPMSEPLDDIPLGKPVIPTDAQSPLGQTAKCCHFSIRGYVADIRRSGRKICGPFVDSLDMSAKLLPPISATKFRWWECPSCFVQMRLTDRPEHDTGSLSVGDGKRDISSEGNQLGVTCTRPPIELSRHQEVSAQKVPQLAEAVLNHLSDSGKTDPSISEHPKDMDHPVSTFREDGGGDPKDVFQTAEVPSHQPVSSVSCKVIRKNVNGKRFVLKLMKKSNPTRLCSSETPDTVNGELNAANITSVSRRSDINCQSLDGKDKLQCPSSVDDWNGKEDSLGSNMMVDTTELDSQWSKSPSCESSEKDTLTESTDIDNCKSDLAIPIGNSNGRRIQRTRLLSDILNKEAEKEDLALQQNEMVATKTNSVLPQIEVMATKVDPVIPQNEVIEAKEDFVLPQNEVVKPGNCSNTEIPQGHVVSVMEQSGKVVESKKRCRHSEVEEDGSSLLCVLKRKIKKAKCVKMDAGSKNNNSPDVDSQQKAGETTFKPLLSRDTIPLIEGCIANVCDLKKQHAKDRTETLQKESVQMKTCENAIKNSVPEGSVRGTEYRDNHSHAVIDVLSRVNHAGIYISSRSHKKVKGMSTDTNINNVNSLNINTVRKRGTPVPLYPRNNNVVSVGSYNTTTKKHKKRKGHNTKIMHQSLTKRSRLHKNKIQGSVSESSYKETKYNAILSQVITDSGSIAHSETIIENEIRGVAILGSHKMKGSLEEKECQVNIKSYANFVQNETATNKDYVDKKDGTDSVDGIPVEILKLLQENWQKRHMDGCSLENMRNNTYEMSGEKIDGMPQLASDVGDRLSTELCKNWNNPHSQCLNHHSQSEAVRLGTKCLSASSKYQPRDSSHYDTNISHHIWVDSIENAYYYKSIGSSSSVLGTCNDQSKIRKQGVGIRGLFRKQTHPAVFSKEHDNSLGIPLVNAMDSSLPENQGAAKQTKNTCGKAQRPREQVSCSGYTSSPPPARVDFRQYLKIPSDTETLFNDNKPTAKELRENDGRKCMDATVVQPQSWKPATGVRTNQENHPMHRHCGVGGPNGYNINVWPQVEIDRNDTVAGNGHDGKVMPLVDTHRNEAISAINLLKLMDSGACSSESSGMSKSRYVSEFGQRPNVSQAYGHGQSLWLGCKDRDHTDNRRQLPSDFSCQHQSSCPPNLFKPDARIGVPLTCYVKNRIAELDCSKPPIVDVDRGFGCFDPTKRCQERNSLTSQAETPARFPFFSVEGLQVPATPNLAAQSPLCHKLGHTSYAGCQTEFFNPPENRMEICVLNRNPADFTILDDDNEYMIGYRDIRTGSYHRRENVSQMLHISRDSRTQPILSFLKGL